MHNLHKSFSPFARLKTAIHTQLKQGWSIEKIAETLCFALALGLFPILGTTTSLCAITGFIFGLNHPLMQLVNYLMTPAHLLLIPLFIRLGETLTGSPHISFSLTESFHFFRQHPVEFLQNFGWTMLRAVLAWALTAPLLSFLLHHAIKRIVREAKT